MTPGEPYDKGVRKNQLTGSYGDFKPSHVKSDGERYPTDVVYFKTAESEGRVWHSTQKPVELGRYLIRTYTQHGDVVLDNCFGSASFLVAAAMEKRTSIGIEINRNIAEFKKETLDLMGVAQQRLSSVADVKVCQSLMLNAELERIHLYHRREKLGDYQTVTVAVSGHYGTAACYAR